MKTTLILCACLLSIAAQAAITVTNTLNPTTISGSPSSPGTNYSTPVIVGYVSFRFNPNFVISQGGLNTTNSAVFYTYVDATTNISFSQCIATNTFSATNSGSITVLPANVTVPIYGWNETIVTNGTTVWQSVITGTP